MSVKAIKNGLVATFPEAIWSSGAPQRAGYVLADEEQPEKILPKEIVDMSTVRKGEVLGVSVEVSETETVIEVPKKKAVVGRAAKKGKHVNRK